MKGSASKLIIVAVGLIAAFVTVASANFHVTAPQQQAVGMETVSILGYGDPRVLVGWSQNVFAAKISSEVGRTPLPGLPEFPHIQYATQVVYNLKGITPKNIIVDYDASGGEEPAVGATYLFAARHTADDTWYYVNAGHEFSTLVNDDPTLVDAQLLTLVEQNSRTYELLDAYPNEELFSGDVKYGHVENSFSSLSDAQKRDVYAKFDELIPKRSAPAALPSSESKPTL